MSRAARVYAPADRPDVEVLVGGHWWQGELRAWYPVGETGWEGQVQWRREAGATRIDTFAEADVRPDTTSRQ